MWLITKESLRIRSRLKLLKNSLRQRLWKRRKVFMVSTVTQGNSSIGLPRLHDRSLAWLKRPGSSSGVLNRKAAEHLWNMLWYRRRFWLQNFNGNSQWCIKVWHRSRTGTTSRWAWACNSLRVAFTQCAGEELFYDGERVPKEADQCRYGNTNQNQRTRPKEADQMSLRKTDEVLHVVEFTVVNF